MRRMLFVAYVLLLTACWMSAHSQTKAYLGGKKLQYAIVENKLVYEVSKNKMVNIDCLKSESEIISFDVTVYYQKVLKSMPNTGACFSDHAKNIIYETPTGNTIYIEKIKAKDANGTIQTLPVILVKLVP